MVSKPTSPSLSQLETLNERSRSIFRSLVETYLETGEPVGSRTLSRSLPFQLSAASIRNVMADLEHLGLLSSPHTSAGRIPSEQGLRLFVDGLLEVGDLTEEERERIEGQIGSQERALPDLLNDAILMLSGLSHCAGLVASSKSDVPLKHLEVVQTQPGQGLVILVSETGVVENRVLDLPLGMTPSALREAVNYLNARLQGRTIGEARQEILVEVEQHKAQLDTLSAQVVERGLATWSGEKGDVLDRTLIVRGQANLLENLGAMEDLERIRRLFEELENKADLLALLDRAETGEGVQIFIGSETELFSLSGSSVIVAPYKNAQQKIVGVIGVIGPTRLNYGRIIPMVDFTAQVIGRMMP
ncbi:MAG: heat-inducible transcriptional repressor HrcA [Pseudomonadota bacterium]